MSNKQIKEFIMKKKYSLLAVIMLLFVLGIAGKTLYEKFLSISHFYVSISGKVVDEKGNLLENVTIKIIRYHSYLKNKGGTPHKNIELIKNNNKFKVSGKVSGISILAGKKGYHPAKFSIYIGEVLEMREQEVEEGVKSGKIKRPAPEDSYKLYENMKYENHDIVLTLRKVNTNSAKLLEYDWKRYHLMLNKDKQKMGVKFTDEPTSRDIDDISLVMGENNEGKLDCWLETAENGGIVFIKPALSIYEMFEAPETGYRQKINIKELDPDTNSFYLKTAEGKYVKGIIDSPLFDPEKKLADLSIDPCAIQPDGSRYLETVNTDLLDEIFEPEDEDGEENDEKEDIDDKPKRETKEEFAKTALIIGVYPDGRVKIKNEIVPLDELDSLLKKHGATAESKVMIEEAEYGYSVKTDILEKVEEKIRKYGIMKIRFR